MNKKNRNYFFLFIYFNLSQKHIRINKISGFDELSEFFVLIRDKFLPIDGSKVDIELFFLFFLNLVTKSLKNIWNALKTIKKNKHCKLPNSTITIKISKERVI